MTTPSTRSRRRPERALKSPLAVAAPVSRQDVSIGTAAQASAAAVTRLTDRESTLAEFEDYLRTVNNRDGRPYEEKSIISYVGPGKNLDVWMAANGIDGDFTDVDTALLNR
jgi:hypothetical protein